MGVPESGGFGNQLLLSSKSSFTATTASGAQAEGPASNQRNQARAPRAIAFTIHAWTDADVPDTSLLSDKPIPLRERLIVPLDVPSTDEARDVVSRLGDACHFYKLGL